MIDLDLALVPLAGYPGTRVNTETGERFYSSAWLSDAHDAALGLVQASELPAAPSTAERVAAVLDVVTAEQARGMLDLAPVVDIGPADPEAARRLALQAATRPKRSSDGLINIGPSGRLTEREERTDALGLVYGALRASLRHLDRLLKLDPDVSPWKQTIGMVVLDVEQHMRPDSEEVHRADQDAH